MSWARRPQPSPADLHLYVCICGDDDCRKSPFLPGWDPVDDPILHEKVSKEAVERVRVVQDPETGRFHHIDVDGTTLAITSDND